MLWSKPSKVWDTNSLVNTSLVGPCATIPNLMSATRSQVSGSDNKSCVAKITVLPFTLRNRGLNWYTTRAWHVCSILTVAATRLAPAVWVCAKITASPVGKRACCMLNPNPSMLVIFWRHSHLSMKAASCKYSCNWSQPVLCRRLNWYEFLIEPHLILDLRRF